MYASLDLCQHDRLLILSNFNQKNWALATLPITDLYVATRHNQGRRPRHCMGFVWRRRDLGSSPMSRRKPCCHFMRNLDRYYAYLIMSKVLISKLVRISLVSYVYVLGRHHRPIRFGRLHNILPVVSFIGWQRMPLNLGLDLILFKPSQTQPISN